VRLVVQAGRRTREGVKPWDDLQARLAFQCTHCLAVELDNHRVPSPTISRTGWLTERRCSPGRSGRPPRETTAATEPGRGGRDKRGGGTRAAAEQPDPQASRGLILHRPVGQGGHPGREQADVQPGLCRTSPLSRLVCPGG
jgi:hypothetical protein